MAFGNISTLYLRASFTSAAVGGTRIAALDDVADAGNDTSSTVTHTSNQTTRRVVIPQQTSTINAPRSDYGFAIAVADMGSATGARRFFPAGTHTAILYATGGNSLGSNTYRLTAYRVGVTPSFTKTLIAGPASTTGSGLGASISIALALPQIIFEPGETILYAIDGECNPGLLTGTITYVLGTGSALQGNEVSRITTPELGVLASGIGNSDGAASVDGKGALLIPARGDSAGAATATGFQSATAGMVGLSEGTATVVGQLSAIAGLVGLSEGIATVDGQQSAIAGMVGNADGAAIADGNLSATAGMVGNSEGIATVDGQFGAIAGFIGNADGAATVDGRASSVAGAVGNADGVATVDGRLGAILGAYGTVEIGAGGGNSEPYPDGLLRLNGKRIESLIGNTGPLPSGTLRLVALP